MNRQMARRRDWVDRLEPYMDRFAWLVAVVVVLYFGAHVLVAVVRG